MKLFKILLVLILFTGGGFLFGAYPDYIKKIITRKNYDYILLTKDTHLFPETLQIWIFERTGIRVQVETDPAVKPDLVFMSLDDLKEEIPKLAMLETNPELSPDFCNQKFHCDNLLPLLWKVEDKNKVTVYALGIYKADKNFKLIAKELLSPEVQKLWINSTQLAGTSLHTEKLEIEENKKPSSFRKLPLNN